jgi:hypothetical protein
LWEEMDVTIDHIDEGHGMEAHDNVALKSNVME